MSRVVPMDPTRCLLGDFCKEELRGSQKTILCFFILLCEKIKKPSLKRKEVDPPIIQFWIDLINKALPLYKMTYPSRDCPKKKFNKIWSEWMSAMSMALEE